MSDIAIEDPDYHWSEDGDVEFEPLEKLIVKKHDGEKHNNRRRERALDDNDFGDTRVANAADVMTSQDDAISVTSRDDYIPVTSQIRQPSLLMPRRSGSFTSLEDQKKKDSIMTSSPVTSLKKDITSHDPPTSMEPPEDYVPVTSRAAMILPSDHAVTSENYVSRDVDAVPSHIHKSEDRLTSANRNALRGSLTSSTSRKHATSIDDPLTSTHPSFDGADHLRGPTSLDSHVSRQSRFHVTSKNKQQSREARLAALNGRFHSVTSQENLTSLDGDKHTKQTAKTSQDPTLLRDNHQPIREVDIPASMTSHGNPQPRESPDLLTSQNGTRQPNSLPDHLLDTTYAGDVGRFKEFYYKIEMDEWGRVNKLLRQHGLPLVEPLHPDKAEAKSDVVAIDPDTSRKIRETVKTLMRDCDRRQELIQELILTNNQLRDDLKSQTNASERFESKAKDLRMMVDTSKLKIQELEEEQQLSTSLIEEEEEKLKNTNSAIKAKCKQLKQRCDSYEEEIERLRKKLRKMTEEDERRRHRQKEVFDQLKKRTGRGSVDEKVLDLIDSYERQLYHLKQELELVKPEGTSQYPEPDNEKADQYDSTPNYKGLIKAYEKQLRDSRKKLKNLENENEVLKLDLAARPELKDLREAQLHIKKLEKMVKKSGMESEKKDSRKYSTKLDDIEYLPASHCQSYLKEICEKLMVYDVEHILPKVEKNTKAAYGYPRLEQFARDVLTIVEIDDVPRPPEYSHKPRSTKPHLVWCEKSWHHVIPTLEFWALQLRSLSELQQSIEKLHSTLLPWKPWHPGSVVTVSRMIEAVDSLADEDEAPPMQLVGQKEQPSRAMLQGVVEHFMTVFDVQRVSGCYARTNDVYAKLGEVHNVQKTLKDLLGLEESAKSSAIIDTVARLCQTRNSTTYHQLKQLLQVEELDSVIRRLEQHENFFPAFQEIMDRLMEILNVQRIDQIIPAVKAMKLLASS